MAAQIGINDLKEISAALTMKTGYAFDNFSQSFLKRRLLLFFEKYHIRQIDQFIKQLSVKLFVESLLYHLSVDTTEMFRDPGFWRSLKSNVLPSSVIRDFPVWFPDIGSGEELYSYRIIVGLSQISAHQESYIHHPSSSRIDEVKTGMLKTRYKDLNENNFGRLEMEGLFESFFNVQNNTQVLKNSTLGTIRHKKAWFLSEPDVNGFGLIFFRNSMLYINKSLQEKVCQFFYDRLVPGGYLVIGIRESLPNSFVNKFQVVDEHERIFRKLI